MANAGAKLSSFPEVNDIQTGDMFPLLSGGDTNAKIDYATLAKAIIAKEVERATAAENKLESEKADKTTATSSADGLMSAADKKAIDREFFRLLPKGGTYIPANADLNSIEYIKVGNYYNPAIGDSMTIKNIPIGTAFIMYVLSPLSEYYDNESTDPWVYRLRIFIDLTGTGMFVQMVDSESTAGSFNYGPWVKMTNSNDLGAVSNTIDTHIANKSNPHAVTKAQVGLGNVDNTSDADKPISMAVQTALDKKADKTIATASADGLMSKTDKAKLDGIDPSAITTNAANIKKNADAISVRASLIPTGKAIYAGDDLNNINYTEVGTYYCSTIGEAQHISNLPEATAFMMTVYNPLGPLTKPLSTPWQYRVQEFMSYYGQNKYIRKVSTDGESNVAFGDWVKMTNSNDLGAVSNTIDTHIANKSNPHAVTKAQVGLGNVANLDQSKAIKSITRSGTTFTATALDGTTTTFTQQDNNTTYGVATSSADGLMSKSDKAKLDGISSGADVSQLAKNTAQIETAGTATNAHSAGEYVMISNALYKVTASVAKGDTWTIGTNVTATNVGSEIGSLKSDLANKLYPVGSIYMSVNATNPAELFGGTWEQIKDRFLLAAGDTHAAGSTGGEEQHKLTISELPPHSHAVAPLGAKGGTNGNLVINDKYGAMSGADTLNLSGGNAFYARNTSIVGEGQAHNNMPPYLTIYMWKRTA